MGRTRSLIPDRRNEEDPAGSRVRGSGEGHETVGVGQDARRKWAIRKRVAQPYLPVVRERTG